MDLKKNEQKLAEIEQLHLLKHINSLSTPLLEQIDKISVTDFLRQKELLLNPKKVDLTNIEAVREALYTENEEDSNTGKKLVSEGKVACLLIAGGQASRLKFEGPKGMYPVSVVKGKTLFQIFAEKALAATKQAGKELPLAIMTSPLNHQTIVNYFQKQNFFGLSPSQIDFFQQDTLPYLDEDGNLFLQSEHSLAVGPNGNGQALHKLVSSEIWRKWKKQGVEYVNQVLIDNPLADPFDYCLIGHQKNSNSDIAIKCTNRKAASEKVGIVVRNQGKIEIVEYSELPNSYNLGDNICANIGLYSYSMEFIKNISDKSLPLHAAHKSIKCFGKERMAWKFEYFIFDILPFTEKICILKYPREYCFSPLKNAKGNDDIVSVQQALQHLDKSTYQKILKKPPPTIPFELKQELYYPTEELLQKIHIGKLNEKDWVIT